MSKEDDDLFAAQEIRLKMHREITNTKFTLSQINTLCTIAFMTDVQLSKYKTTAIYNFQTGLKHNFPNCVEYSHLLLTMDQDLAIVKLKEDLSAVLALKGLELDARTANTIYSSHAAKETGINPPKPYSGPKHQQRGRNMTDENTSETTAVEKAAKEAVDFNRQIKRTGSGFTAKATHAGYKLYGMKNPRKETDPGCAGMKHIMENPGITFEDFAAKFPIDHLNWDINRDAVLAKPADEEFDYAAHMEEIARAAEAKKPKKKPEAAESEEPAEPVSKESEEAEEAEA